MNESDIKNILYQQLQLLVEESEKDYVSLEDRLSICNAIHKLSITLLSP